MASELSLQVPLLKHQLQNVVQLQRFHQNYGYKGDQIT